MMKRRMNTMLFKEAFECMKEGKKVRLPEWIGYWMITNDKIYIHCSDGKLMDFCETQNPIETVSFMMRDDWEIVIVDHDDLRVPAVMDFSEALRHVKLGNKICRDGWNGKGMFVVYQKGYPDGIPCNKQTAEAWGMREGDLFKCRPYLQIKNVDGSHSMWVPSIGDVLATDWRLYNGDQAP